MQKARSTKRFTRPSFARGDGQKQHHLLRPTIALVVCAFLALTSTKVRGDYGVAITPMQQIPQGYRSWSLFLVCNPTWIIEQQNPDPGHQEYYDAGVRQLYQMFLAFSDAIGPKNLAVWFWKEHAHTATPGEIDVSRCAEYCEKFKLLPSETPAIVVTTRHPDDAEIGDRYVLKLNGTLATESSWGLAKLTDQIMVAGLKQQDLDAAERWHRMADATTRALKAAGSYFNKVTLSIKTEIFNFEITHSEGGG